MRRRSLSMGLFGSTAPRPVIVRDYGRDSLLVWANMLLGPLFAALGLRIGLQSEERLAARMQADAAAMRRKGYLVGSVQTFSLPVPGAKDVAASWYRVTYELTAPGGTRTEDEPEPHAEG